MFRLLLVCPFHSKVSQMNQYNQPIHLIWILYKYQYVKSNWNVFTRFCTLWYVLATRYVYEFRTRVGTLISMRKRTLEFSYFNPVSYVNLTCNHYLICLLVKDTAWECVLRSKCETNRKSPNVTRTGEFLTASSQFLALQLRFGSGRCSMWRKQPSSFNHKSPIESKQLNQPS